MILDEINMVQAQLDASLKTLRKNGLALAEAEQNYRIKLRQEILYLRSEGYPVTIIPDLARGNEEVSRLAFNRNVCEATYKANLEAINVKKLELNVLKIQFDKEYSNE